MEPGTDSCKVAVLVVENEALVRLAPAPLGR